MTLPQAVSRHEWLVARKELLVKEKELTRQRDALNVERRMLPMVEIVEDCVFEGPQGEASPLDLFDGRRQLIVGHFMFGPSWDEGCPSCSAGADEVSDGLLEHLHAHGSDFNYDVHVTLDVRPRRRDDRRLVLLPRPHRAGPSGGLGGAERRAAGVHHATPDFA